MKSPMNMAPNKMVSPAKALSDLKPNLGTGENEIDPNSKFGKKVAAAGPPMKEPMKMKSPMKMGSAYKLDKSGFKLKSAPVNMKTPGSIAKLAGVSPAKLDLTKAKNVAGDLVEGLKGFAQGSKRSISAGIRGAKSRYNRSKSSRTGEEVGLAGESKTAKEEGRS